MKRTATKAIKIGNVQIGGQNKVIIQSMCNTKTKDFKNTLAQIKELEKVGCQIVRLAILNEEDAKAIKEIKKHTTMPLVADIHYDYRLALIAIENGIDKIRINPGNIGKISNVEAVVKSCKEKDIPIRIGINSGSLEKNILAKYQKPTAQAMIESAQNHVKILEDLNFTNICLSFKSSDSGLCIDSYQLAAKTFNYPLHLGVTEAGSFFASSIRSSAALGILLHQGIGDTIRISVSANPVEEIKIAKELLATFNLIDNYPKLISCPTCGRLAYDMLNYVKEIEDFLATLSGNIKVAVMGCTVNGPGEAREADIGIFGGGDKLVILKNGKIFAQGPPAEMIKLLKQQILIILEEKSKNHNNIKK
ncbi:MAG: flavodoxin-dependent (E)-4-hydroxy-3-methylbut-2-enyl-diphosphate synthase [Erysipelotrichaceae bacterium]